MNGGAGQGLVRNNNVGRVPLVFKASFPLLMLRLLLTSIFITVLLIKDVRLYMRDLRKLVLSEQLPPVIEAPLEEEADVAAVGAVVDVDVVDAMQLV